MDTEEVFNEYQEETEEYNDYEIVIKELEKFDQYVEKLWITLYQSYISDINNMVLNKMDKYQKSKFYKFMYDNSPIYKKLLIALNKLY